MFIDIDWSSILPVAASYLVGFGVGLVILGHGCSKLGRYLAECRETQTTALIPETDEERILFGARHQ
jgi:hypothetical protein